MENRQFIRCGVNYYFGKFASHFVRFVNLFTHQKNQSELHIKTEEMNSEICYHFAANRIETKTNQNKNIQIESNCFCIYVYVVARAANLQLFTYFIWCVHAFRFVFHLKWFYIHLLFLLCGISIIAIPIGVSLGNLLVFLFIIKIQTK